MQIDDHFSWRIMTQARRLTLEESSRCQYCKAARREMRGLLGPLCLPADSHYPAGTLQSSLPTRPTSPPTPPNWIGGRGCTQQTGCFFCVPTALAWIGLLMSFDTNGTVRCCDCGFSPHAARTWQEVTPDSAPFHPPKNSMETILSSQLGPSLHPLLSSVSSSLHHPAGG